MCINNQKFSKYHFSCFVFCSWNHLDPNFIHPKKKSSRRGNLVSQTHGVDSASPSNPSGWKMHLQVGETPSQQLVGMNSICSPTSRFATKTRGLTSFYKQGKWCVFLSERKWCSFSLGKFFLELDSTKTHKWSVPWSLWQIFCWDLSPSSRKSGISPSDEISSPGILCLSQQAPQRSTIPLGFHKWCPFGKGKHRTVWFVGENDVFHEFSNV